MKAFALLMELALSQTPVAVDHSHSPCLILEAGLLLLYLTPLISLMLLVNRSPKVHSVN